MKEKYDIALSYAFGGDVERDVIAQVRQIFADSGLRVYIISEDNKMPEDEWRLRYFTGMVNSRFFVPVLTQKYLTGAGAREEVEAMMEVLRRRMFTTFFHPTVPIIPDIGHLENQFLDPAAFKSMAISEEQYKWLKTHAFPVSLAWGPETVGGFFRSLVRGATNRPNIEWLEFVAAQVRALRFEERLGRPCVTVQLGNSLFELDYEFIIGPGGTRFTGCHIPRRDAVEQFELGKLTSYIESHLASAGGQPVMACVDCSLRVPVDRATALVCQLCDGQLELLQDYFEVPNPVNKLTCDNCGRFSHPTSYQLGADCPHCGAHMSNIDGEQARHFLSDRYGRGGE